MDRRDVNHRWYDRFDEKRMVFEVESLDFDVPARFEVCETCEGKGKHVNPSIDSHGLSREDFDEDPDFYDDYRSGMYDVPCNECHGNRVAPEPDFENMTDEERDAVEDRIQGHYDMIREIEAERRAGA